MTNRNVTNGHIGPGSFHTAPASSAEEILNSLGISKKRHDKVVELVDKLRRKNRERNGVK
jgi:hypothetical protein